MNTSKRLNSEICGVSFGIYNAQDINQLSVMRIESHQTFDPLGHPMSGGLCDNALGAVKRNDLCTTCGLSDTECFGHFGHISLPLPVFNPFLIKQLFRLLQMCCFSCNNFLFSAKSIETVIAQMEALSYGLDSLGEELDCLASHSGNHNQDVASIRAYMRAKLRARIEEECLKMKSKQISSVKSVIQKQQILFKSFITGKLLKANRICQNCNVRKQGMTVINNSLIVMNASKLTKKVSKKPNEPNELTEELNEDNDGNDESNDPTAQLKGKSYLTPIEARKHLRSLWNVEKESLSRLFKFLNIELQSSQVLANQSNETFSPIDVFFWDVIPVPPNRFRPLHFLNGRQYENEHTLALSEVIMSAELLSNALRTAKQGNRQNVPNNDNQSDNPSTSTQLPISDKSKEIAKFHMAWQRLQLLCNRLYDSDLDKLPDNKLSGVKQTLEKKEGLFRKHMMGKRVNFAARSVISPDPYIMVDEIGIPLVFATKLTYPQPVTQWNLAQLKQMVMNGPDKHPGAVSVIFEDGINLRLKPDDEAQRKSIAERLGVTTNKYGSINMGRVKIVNRHLIAGDVLLLNRQPTLHKPSIMAHKARILPKEKTLRLHYANCKCYNADFDGDEMNAHFPQNELARSEAYNIANVNFQYLVPKDGSPLSGLIQDHVISAVLLTIRGQFFDVGDYQELLYGALSFLGKPIKMMPPAIIKPKSLWTGKQIVSSLIYNIVPSNKKRPTFSIASKINPKILQIRKQRKWTAGGTPLQLDEMCESQVIIREGELVCGIIDKVNLGANPYGLIHICYELYGGSVSCSLLTSFARLCTNFLQIHHGFTLGIHDILVGNKSNAKRKKFIKNSLTLGDKVAADALGVPDCDDKKILLDKLKSAHTNKNDYYMKQLDKCMKSQTDEINNKINESCLPKGLIKHFPENNLQMMIQSGAKGGTVNAIQISCLLGQIELEGRRIPLMMSGRTLPSFKPYDTTPRAGGFISGRFMTGIRPQEFFFHCMAGREGLIDTAVKTSRSGYLQRCLIKHLEGLIVNYDLTVRDSEGSVMQFLYGCDGLDILKSQLLKEKTFPIVIQNNEVLKPGKQELKILQKYSDKDLHNYRKSIDGWIDANGMNRFKKFRDSPFLKFSHKLKKKNKYSREEIIDKWRNLKSNSKIKYEKACQSCPDPLHNKFQPDVNLGAISEKLDDIIENYISTNRHNLLNNSLDPLSISSVEFRQTINTRYMKSLCHPGEAVGLLAAQSIGEPSTQMTLNTFHFAGRGEMNVTLGIPRLREILMTASPSISTPSMDIVFRKDIDASIIEKEAERVRLKLNAVKLCDVLEFIDITEKIEITEFTRFRTYDMNFNFLPKSYYKHKFYTNPSHILKFMEDRFFRILIEVINKKIKMLAKSHGLFDNSNANRSRISTKNKNDNNNEDIEEDYDGSNGRDRQAIDGDDDISSGDETAENEGDTTSARVKSRHNQDLEYEEPEEEEIEVIGDSEDEQFNETVNDNMPEDQNCQSEEQNDLSGNYSQNSRLSKKKSRKSQLLAQLETRKNKVCNQSPFIVDYDFDTLKEEWCRLVIKYDITNSKLDMSSIVEEESKRAFVHKVGNIERAFLVKDHSAAKQGASFDKMLKTEGVSLLDVVAYDYIFDINRVYTNDIQAIANTYGIEAGAQAIQREISNVFAVYGIYVDSRHLSLVSDYMTFSGEIKGMNRQSMDGVSPIQAMTFETTTNFLKTATLIGLKDHLTSPSARIVIGRPSNVGTGVVDMLCNPALITGTKPHQSFGGELRKSFWKSRQNDRRVLHKRKYQENNIPLEVTKILNKRIKFES